MEQLLKLPMIQKIKSTAWRINSGGKRPRLVLRYEETINNDVEVIDLVNIKMAACVKQHLPIPRLVLISQICISLTAFLNLIPFLYESKLYSTQYCCLINKVCLEGLEVGVSQNENIEPNGSLTWVVRSICNTSLSVGHLMILTWIIAPSSQDYCHGKRKVGTGPINNKITW